MKVSILYENYENQTIFHITHVSNAIDIIKDKKILVSDREDNYLKAQGYGYFGKPTVSFTFYKEKILRLPQWNGIEFVVFAVDAHKLSTKYKLYPFSYEGTKYEPINKERMKKRKQKEKTNSIPQNDIPRKEIDIDDIEVPFFYKYNKFNENSYEYMDVYDYYNEPEDKVDDTKILGDFKKESEIVAVKDITNFMDYVKYIQVDKRVYDENLRDKKYIQSYTYKEIFELSMIGKNPLLNVQQNKKNSLNLSSYEEFKKLCNKYVTIYPYTK